MEKSREEMVGLVRGHLYAVVYRLTDYRPALDEAGNHELDVIAEMMRDAIAEFEELVKHPILEKPCQSPSNPESTGSESSFTASPST